MTGSQVTPGRILTPHFAAVTVCNWLPGVPQTDRADRSFRATVGNVADLHQCSTRSDRSRPYSRSCCRSRSRPFNASVSATSRSSSHHPSVASGHSAQAAPNPPSQARWASRSSMGGKSAGSVDRQNTAMPAANQSSVESPGRGTQLLQRTASLRRPSVVNFQSIQR